MSVRAKVTSAAKKVGSVADTPLSDPEIKRFFGATLKKFRQTQKYITRSLAPDFWVRGKPDLIRPNRGKEVFRRWRLGMATLWSASEKLRNFTFEVRKKPAKNEIILGMIPANRETAKEREERLKKIEKQHTELVKRARELNEAMKLLKAKLLPVIRASNEELRDAVQSVLEAQHKLAQQAVQSAEPESPKRIRLQRLMDKGDDAWMAMDAETEWAKVIAQAEAAWKQYTRCTTAK